jgi:cytochrome P450
MELLHTNDTEKLSLAQLLDPEVLANPYPLYRRLRTSDPVHWDPYLHCWVVTRYDDVVTVLHRFSAQRTPSPEQLSTMDLSALGPIAQVMVRQMLFMDPPAHTRIRGLASAAFTPRRIDSLREHIREITNSLIDAMAGSERVELMTQFANLLPSTVTAEMLGVPVADRDQLKAWSADFAEMLGNFQHNPGRAHRVLRAVEDMTAYFRAAIRNLASAPREGLIQALLTAEVEGDRLNEDEVIANTIVTMVGGQETTTNLIGNGILTLLRHPDSMRQMRDDPGLTVTAIEELLRFESPSQHTARVAPCDFNLGGKLILKRQAVMAVMAAANRDPEHFVDPDRLDLKRADNHHLAFGWGAHFCFGAPLARLEAQLAFPALLKRLPNMQLAGPRVEWRPNLGLRGLTSLPLVLASQTAPGAAPGAAAASEAL